MASAKRQKKAESDATAKGSTTDYARLNAVLGGGDDGSKVARDFGARDEAARAGTVDKADSAELLCWAAGNGKSDVVAALIERGAKPNEPVTFTVPPYDPHDEEQKWTEADWFGDEFEPKTVALRPLGAAVHMGHADAARLLLDAGADINADSGSGPPIYHAVRRGHAKVVQLLVERGADLSVRNGLGNTLLYEVAGSTHADIADILLRAGADPNETNGGGDSPLVAASIRGDIRIVRALLAAGANADPPEPTPEMITNPTLRMLRSTQNNYSPPLVHAAEIGHLEVVRALLDAGADTTRKNGYGQTAYEAARRGNHREVALLLKNAGAAAPPTAKRPVDLFMAAEVGDVAAVREALARGMRADARSGINDDSGLGSFLKGVKPKNRFNAVMKAFTSMNMELVDAVERDAQEERQGAAWHHGMSALMLASKHGHAEVVRTLLEAGATPDLRSSEPEHSGWIAPHYAAAGNHGEVTRLLLDAGANVSNEAVDILGDPTGTPLHVAASNGHVDAARLLLERGAKHTNTAGGDTPLARAAASGHHDVIRLLLDAGAKPDARAGKTGRTALHAAAKAGRVDTVKLLLAVGADANLVGDDGNALGAAANGRRANAPQIVPVMKVLIDAGAEVNRAGPDGGTPLFDAVRTPAAAEFLLANGADPNIRARDGCNALHRAVAHNKLDSVKLLLAAGVDPNVIDREEGYTRLDSAIVRGHKECRALLEAAGAKRAKDLKKKTPDKPPAKKGKRGR